jgi:hypothetical protein
MLGFIKDKYQMMFFMSVVAAHFFEHLVQIYQLKVLGMPRSESLGLLGYYYPWLIHSEWLHYGLALFMLLGIYYLRPMFLLREPADTWWTITLGLQFLHHIEHLVPLCQALSGHYLYGASKPQSLLQLWFPRIELHFTYNVIVMIPMCMAMFYLYEGMREGGRSANR